MLPFGESANIRRFRICHGQFHKHEGQQDSLAFFLPVAVFFSLLFPVVFFKAKPRSGMLLKAGTLLPAREGGRACRERSGFPPPASAAMPHRNWER